MACAQEKVAVEEVVTDRADITVKELDEMKDYLSKSVAMNQKIADEMNRMKNEYEAKLKECEVKLKECEVMKNGFEAKRELEMNASKLEVESEEDKGEKDGEEDEEDEEDEEPVPKAASPYKQAIVPPKIVRPPVRQQLAKTADGIVNQVRDMSIGEIHMNRSLIIIKHVAKKNFDNDKRKFENYVASCFAHGAILGSSVDLTYDNCIGCTLVAVMIFPDGSIVSFLTGTINEIVQYDEEKNIDGINFGPCPRNRIKEFRMIDMKSIFGRVDASRFDAEVFGPNWREWVTGAEPSGIKPMTYTCWNGENGGPCTISFMNRVDIPLKNGIVDVVMYRDLYKIMWGSRGTDNGNDRRSVAVSRNKW